MNDLLLKNHFYIENNFSDEEKKVEEREELLLFKSAKLIFGLKLDLVKEIIVSIKITKIPYTKQFVLGLINFRNEILSVIDIAGFLGIGQLKKSQYNRMIIVKMEKRIMAFLVDNIIGVVNINKKHLSCNTDSMGLKEVFIDSIYNIKKLTIVKLNFEKIIFSEKIDDYHN